MTATTRYQPVWRDGREVAAGYRDGGPRFEIVRRALDSSRVRTPFTVLDFGACEGYFTRRLLEAGASHVTAVEENAAALARGFPDGTPAGVRVIHGRMGPDELAALGTFDVVLGLSVLHHNPDWLELLEGLTAAARRVCVVETPHPREQLRQAVARHELGAIDATVRTMGEPVGTAPGVWQRDLARRFYAIPGRPLFLIGSVFGGTGNNSAHTVGMLDELEAALGYRPEPGSLNLRLTGAGRSRLGPPAFEVVDARRGRGGRRGGDYQFWPARLGQLACHVMTPGVRGHGDGTIEIMAPLRLRDALGLRDGDTLEIEVGP